MTEQNQIKTWWADLLTLEELEEYDCMVGTLMSEHPRQGPLDWQARLFQVVPKSDFDAVVRERDGLKKRVDVFERAKIIWERKNGDASDLNDASQEANHYNWLDEQNKKLDAEIQMGREKLKWLVIHSIEMGSISKAKGAEILGVSLIDLLEELKIGVGDEESTT